MRTDATTPRDFFIPSQTVSTPVSTRRLWTAWILSGLAIVFLLFDAAMKLVEAQVVLDSFVELGYPAGYARGIGFLLLISTLTYAFPRTSLLGAILLTGHLGGAIATQLRLSQPVFTHILFPVYIAALVWGGLYLRDTRLRTLLPLMRTSV